MSAASGPSMRSRRTQSTPARPIPRVLRVVRLEGDKVRLDGVVASLSLAEVSLLNIASGQRRLVHERPRIGRPPRARHPSETQTGRRDRCTVVTRQFGTTSPRGPRAGRVGPQPSSLLVCDAVRVTREPELETTDGERQAASGRAKRSVESARPAPRARVDMLGGLATPGWTRANDAAALDARSSTLDRRSDPPAATQRPRRKLNRL